MMKKEASGFALSRHWIWVLLLAALVALAVEFLCVRFVPVHYVPVEADGEVRTYDDSAHVISLYPNTEHQSTLVGYPNNRSVRLGVFQPVEPNPSITYMKVNNGFNTIRLTFSQPADDDAKITFRLLLHNHTFDSVEPIVATIGRGSTELVVKVPRRFYLALRMEPTGPLHIASIDLLDDLSGYRQVAGSLSPIRMLLLGASSFVLLSLLLHHTPLIAWCSASTKRGKAYLAAHGKGLLLATLIATLLGLIAFLVDFLARNGSANGIFSGSFNPYRLLFFLACGATIVLLFSLRKKVGAAPQKAFLGIALIIGALYAAAAPISMDVVFDDVTHYENAVLYAYFTTPYASIPDERMITRVYSDPVFSVTEAAALRADRNAEATRGAIETLSRGGQSFATMVGYLPMSIMLALARVLRLPFDAYFVFGRLGNLLFYCIITYFAIKRLASGKLLMAFCALYPVSLFLASGYSYDGWIIALFLFGFAGLLSQWQHPKARMQWKAAASILLPFMLGCLVKAVYFPVLIMPLFLGRDKFEGRKQRMAYSAAVLVSMLVVIMTFFPGFVASPDIYNDPRGGDVGSTSQLSSMLANPLGYLGILARTIASSFQLAFFEDAVTFFARLGHPSLSALWQVLFVMTVLLAVLDKNDHDLAIRPWARLIAVGASLLALSMMATALYIGFTPVGNPEINGYQPRYILPVLFPMLTMLTCARVRHTLDRNRLATAALSISACVLLASFYDVCISKYFV